MNTEGSTVRNPQILEQESRPGGQNKEDPGECGQVENTCNKLRMALRIKWCNKKKTIVVSAGRIRKMIYEL